MTQLTSEERLAVLERAFANEVNAHSKIHAMEEGALQLRANELERRLQEMNQFRQQISDERGKYVLRESYDERHEALNKRVLLLELSNSNLQGRLYMVGAVVSVVVSLVVVAVNMVIKLWR